MMSEALHLSPSPPILREVDGPIAVIRLCRPRDRNPLSLASLESLRTELGAIGADAAIRCLVIEAEGPAFSAGHDLKEIQAHRADADQGRAYFAALMALCAEVMQRIVALPQPVIAAVEGVASAAGCQLVATCDLAVAGADARFVTPGVNIGLFCSTPMVALSRTIAPKHAMEMLLTGEAMTADEAMRVGLVNRVVAAGEARDAALAMAAKIAAKSHRIVKIGKQAFYRQSELPLAEAYRHASAVMVENLLVENAKEGIGAFLAKRPPIWRD
jgi:enoyl-CoA hydratase/carnithine racemase